MRVIDVFSNNFDKILGKKRRVKFIILHYTGMQSTIESLKRLKNKKSRVSSHYLISREGSVYQLVEDRKIAWHAGKSKWLNNKNLNRSSIGIELQNRGHRLGYQSFPNRQINKLLRLCFLLKKKI